MLRDLIVGPHQISFDITNKCNLRCLHCYNSSGENLASQNELTDQEVLDFIDEFKSIKLLNFCFCGGEPLLRKELIVEAAKITYHSFQIEITNAADRETIFHMLSALQDLC